MCKSTYPFYHRHQIFFIIYIHILWTYIFYSNQLAMQKKLADLFINIPKPWQTAKWPRKQTINQKYWSRSACMSAKIYSLFSFWVDNWKEVNAPRWKTDDKYLFTTQITSENKQNYCLLFIIDHGGSMEIHYSDITSHFILYSYYFYYYFQACMYI